MSTAPDPSEDTSAERRLFRQEAFERRGRGEPIDGLLRITAPHEWVVLAALGAALLGLLMWAIFGSIDRGISADCVLQRGVSANIGLVVATVPLADTQRLAEGMRANVVTAALDDPLTAHVLEISGRAPTTAGEPDDAEVQLLLTEPLPAVLLDGSACHLRIVTETHAPIRLIAQAGLVAKLIAP